jgi:hypothetical protein
MNMGTDLVAIGGPAQATIPNPIPTPMRIAITAIKIVVERRITTVGLIPILPVVEAGN